MESQNNKQVTVHLPAIRKRLRRRDVDGKSPTAKCSLRAWIIVAAGAGVILIHFNILHLQLRTHTNPTFLLQPHLKSLPNKSRHVHTVFSTSCNPYQDWQSHVLATNHQKLQLPGNLIRLDSCSDPSYEQPRNSYNRYRVVRTPDFAQSHSSGFDYYSPINRPMALHYWLSRQSDDTDIPRNEDVLIMVDPDMVFLKSTFNVSSIRSGYGVAAKYGLGGKWVADFGWRFCGPDAEKCQDAMTNPDAARVTYSYGHPFVLTAGDVRRWAPLWTDVLLDIMNAADLDLGWMKEMYAAILALRRLDIVVDVRRTMVARIDAANLLAWKQMKWGGVNGDGMAVDGDIWVVHYCQTYRVGNFSWNKHAYRSLDLRQCRRPDNVPLPSGADAKIMKMARGKPFVKSVTIEGGVGSLTLQSRETSSKMRLGRDGAISSGGRVGGGQEVDSEVASAYILEKALVCIHESVKGYYDEWC